MFAIKSFFVKNTGFSVVEIMLTLAISSILFGLLLEIYLASEETLRWQTSLSSMVNAAETASAILRSEIKASTQIGNARLTSDFPIASHTEYTLNFQNKLEMRDNMITIRHADINAETLRENMRIQNTLMLGKKIRFNKNDILIITNTYNAEIFAVKNVTFTDDRQIITTNMPLKYSYMIGDNVSKFAVNQFYVEKTPRKTYALYVKDIKQRKNELVENIRKINVTYLVNSGNTVKEISPNNFINPSEVIGVRIEMQLVNSLFKKNWYVYASL